MAAFDNAFSVVIGHEGGYANDPRDPGGETKFGISKRAYPAVDIKSLTLEQAKDIYRRDFWLRLRCDSLPESIALVAFDSGVNCGVDRAARWLQVAVDATPDGIIGPRTLSLAGKAKTVDVVIDILSQRNVHNASLSTWPTFGKGWSRRLFSLAFQSMVA